MAETVINFKLMPYQLDVIQSQEPLYGLVGGRGTGKSVTVAVIAAMALNRGEKIIVLAQSYKSLTEAIWVELKKRLTQFKIPFKANESTLSITNPNGGKIITGTYQALDALRGISDCSLLICDEIALAPPNLFGIVAPCLRGEGINPRIRFATSPKMASWWNVYVKKNNVKYAFGTTYDNKFLTKESIALMESSITDEHLRRQELMGEMIDSLGDNSLILPKDFKNFVNESLPKDKIYIGVDSAGFGVDNNAIIVRNDQRILEAHKIRVATSAEIESIIENDIHKYGEPEFIACDQAYGTALFEKLSTKHQTFLVAFSGKAENPRYYNRRASMYFELANAIRQGFYIDNEDIVMELVNTTYKLKHEDKIILESKDLLKQIIGRSPDLSDALALTFYDGFNPIDYKYHSTEEENMDNYTWNAFAMDASF